MAKKVKFRALRPAPGPWSLDWSRIDRDGPFPWPESSSRDYYLLAGYLARLNELPFDEVMTLERVHGGSAIHALDEYGMSDAAGTRWAEVYRTGGFDAESSPQYDIVTMTYCIKQVDSRRVIVAVDGQNRVVYPLWWDTKHEVSGSHGGGEPEPCSFEACHHLPDSVG